MADSPLLQLVRDSIVEVLQARRFINLEEILESYPVLQEQMNCQVEIFLEDKLRASYKTSQELSLAENIFICAKKAAFEDPNNPPLKIREYLHSEIVLTLFTPQGEMHQKSEALLQKGDTTPFMGVAKEFT